MIGTPRLQLDDELAALAAFVRASTVQVHARGGHGSGFIASGGMVLTNAHVARGDKAQVVSADGQSLRGEVWARAPELDLAAIRVRADGLTPLAFRDASTLRPGDVVMAVGNPLDLVGAVTAGIVHRADARGRRVVADVQLRPGNSGGPLADMEGRVVGVNAMVADGLAVAIGSSVVKRFLDAPLSRPYLGVVTETVVVSVMGERRLGLLITEVIDATPAASAALRIGQVVIGVEGRLFEAPGDLFDEVQSAGAGGRIRLDVYDGGRVRGADVVIGLIARTDAA